MAADSPDAFLAHVLQVFRPYLDRLVLVGGFAARLYALHPQAAPTGLRLVRTFDADFATPPRVERVTGRSLYDLARAADFDEELLREFEPRGRVQRQ